jgi:hypothetical protein
MPKFRVDLRKPLRAIATQVQEANVARLLGGQSVSGGDLAAAKVEPSGGKPGRRRIRVFGVRHSLADLAGRVGVKSGEMLKDLARRGNQKIKRTGFKIVPSASVWTRFFVFNKGDREQAARPVSGMTGEQLDDAAARVSTEARDQFVRNLKDRGYGFR